MKPTVEFLKEAINLLSFALPEDVGIVVGVFDKSDLRGVRFEQKGRNAEYEDADDGVKAFIQASLSSLFEEQTTEEKKDDRTTEPNGGPQCG